MKRISHYQTRDQSLQRWTGEVRQVMNEVQDRDIVNGVLIEGVSLAQATTTYINHGLGYRARGWVLVDNDKAMAGLRRLKASEVKDAHIALYADTITSGPATISVWVF